MNVLCSRYKKVSALVLLLGSISLSSMEDNKFSIKKSNNIMNKFDNNKVKQLIKRLEEYKNVMKKDPPKENIFLANVFARHKNIKGFKAVNIEEISTYSFFDTIVINNNREGSKFYEFKINVNGQCYYPCVMSIRGVDYSVVNDVTTWHSDVKSYSFACNGSEESYRFCKGKAFMRKMRKNKHVEHIKSFPGELFKLEGLNNGFIERGKFYNKSDEEKRKAFAKIHKRSFLDK